jgi:hypothetical protein
MTANVDRSRFRLDRQSPIFYESATISETALRELPDCEAQKRRARHLQKSAA